jgi:imidazolonepropionase-like amidohydrolase
MRLIARVLLLSSVACARNTGDDSSPRPLAITGITVVDVLDGSVRPEMTIVVVGERIQAVGTSGAVPVPRHARTIRATGKYVIPGLWDAHVHLSVAGSKSLPLFVAHGVTSVRDMGSRLSDIRAWRDSIQRGLLIGPHIRAAGPILESARWLSAVQALPMPATFPLWDLSPRIGVGTPEEARATVDSLAETRVDLIKVRTVASTDVFRAIAGQAKTRGLPLAGHAPSGIDLGEASALGLRSVEHSEPTVFALDTMSVAARLQRFERLARNGTWVVPTIVAEMNWRLTPDTVVLRVIADSESHEPRRRHVPNLLVDFWRFQMATKQFEGAMNWQQLHERGMQELRAMRVVGVPMMTGTDFGAVLVFPGSSLHEEFVLMQEKIGMTTAEILRSATREPARFFGAQDSVGAVAGGHLADFVLLDANPLNDIRNTRRISAVVLRGKFLDRGALDSLISAAER